MLRRLSDVFFMMVRGVRDGLRECWNLLVVVVSYFNPRQLPRIVSRDTSAVMASGRVVAQGTSSTLIDIILRIVLSPVWFVRWLIHLPGRLWFFVRTRSWLQLAIGSAVMIIGVTTVVWPTVTIIRERRIQNLRVEQYKQLDQNMSIGDYKGARHNLSVLVLKTPDDPRLAARLAALDAGEAPQSDSKMCRLLMRYHFGGGRMTEAVREAQKYLNSEPRDWEALLILAHVALRQGDRTGAAKAVSQLPRAYEPHESPSMWSCMIAARIFRELDEKARLNELISLLTDRYVPLVRRSAVLSLDFGSRLQLVEVYNLCLSDLAQQPSLKQYWVPVQEICHGVATAADAPLPVLAQVGVAQEQQREKHLREMLRLKYINDETYQQYADEIENRLTNIWKRIRDTDPKHTLGYMGPAMQKARAGDLRGGVADIEMGLSVCGVSPDLIEKKAELLRRLDPASGLAFLEQALAGQALDSATGRVVTEAALAAGRPDRALEAIRRTLTAHPDLPWARRLEAEILLTMGRPTEAVATLANILPVVSRDSAIGVLYVRALAASGAAGPAEQFLMEAIARPEGRPAALAGADALSKLGYHDAAVNVLRRLIVEEPMNANAQIVLGDALRSMAEQAAGGWDRGIVNDALKAYRMAQTREPRHLGIANNIAWLELVALDLPKLAYDSAQPLRDATNLPIDMQETVGATYVGVGQFESGRAALKNVLERSGPRAPTLAYLALAYHGLNQPGPAQEHLIRAMRAPKHTAREGELVDAIRKKIERSIR